MPRERLLKRIRAWSRRESGAGNDIAAYTESVLQDVGALLNTRRGTVVLDDNYGMPDFSNLFNSLAPPELDAIQKALRTCLDGFEKRLGAVTVEYTPRDSEFGVLRFTVNARLKFRNQESPTSFFCLLQGDGSIDVQA